MKRKMVLLFALILIAPPATWAGAVANCTDENSAVTTTPTADFHDNEDGTVTHKPTGLVWMRCSLGQSWDSNAGICADTANSYNWQQALAAAQSLNSEGYAGQSDWRLPNKNELASIVEERCWSPAINFVIFPNTPAAGFWSSSPDAEPSSDGWYRSGWGVNFDDGSVIWNFKAASGKVRLVRSEP
ncbi:DUF1566 domain-containing protein [Desulfurivibrio alkaliphilus]|uniref:Lcl C-terminal domain-containing protein n=1 Tax=Desulfurivibrio alkaliphilus (strain DSM 19089 / UNIQEM U267 / AHT2) TaxID=589865 RepID=D6Z0F5_DESAT|nr:DUF1566 domain-containing protein [Desulfurivibrio alkaliphilus]ADH85184.1 protein of unknown function DUF1566 [Desulfurivibrio alkaliphilus AHT 2]